MKVLVTGPDGVLGSNVVRELLNRGHEVSVLLLPGSTSPTLVGLNITSHYGNILNPDDIDKCVAGSEAVIHCAASTNVFPARDPFINKVNIEGTENIISACKKHSVKRVIYVGTANSFGYGTSIDKPGVEGNPYTSIKYGLDYMDSKRIAQEIILEAFEKDGFPVIVVNPTFMIGPYDSKPSSGEMILAVLGGKLPGYTEGGKNFVAVKDAATAISNALTMGRLGECYILGNENLTFKEAFGKMAKVLGVKPPTRKLSRSIVVAFGSLNSFFARLFKFKPGVTKELAIISCDTHFYSPEKARKELLLPSTPIETAVQECYDWFLANGYIKNK